MLRIVKWSAALVAVVSGTAAVLGVTALSSEAATTLTVAADGTGQYKTVQAAVNAVATNNASRATINIKAGTYREIVS
ncbi:pectinesterase family protein, partial [Actinoplanes sp. NPDC026619]|uniref:pectinesterase family protein n=1 Tax=Actinoplanes sp. NPDC026619 TaxID=3155798 RepID=UPI0033EAB15B